MTGNETPLWTPSPARRGAAALTNFMRLATERAEREIGDYNALWRWSIADRPAFWLLVWEFCGVIGEKGATILENGDAMPGARFFPEARLNFAENLLRRNDDSLAIIFRDEPGNERALTFAQLRADVSRWQQALRQVGVGVGDRVAGCLPNMPEAVVAMLATVSLGAVWSSASPDFGTQGLVDRFGQIAPKVMVAVDGYHYGGKVIDCLEKVRAARPQLGDPLTVIVPFVASAAARAKGFFTVDEFLQPFAAQPVAFTRVPFDHPLFILYSSGTTGAPKCIVHGHGGTLLQLMKEHRLHCDIRPGDRVFYFTTCGWMMWNWLAAALASEATLLLYDANPLHHHADVLWDYTSRHGCTLFGTSAKYIDALKSLGREPGRTHDLSALRTVCSTGSPLVHESFDYVYRAIKSDVHLASISGGTDICSCFVLGNQISPVWRGEIQGPGLGLAVDIFDEEGKPVPSGQAGELVCTKPFPAMPVMFWNDPDGIKYGAAYFEKFPDIWMHGDWAQKTAHGGFVILGRSDATLKPAASASAQPKSIVRSSRCRASPKASPSGRSGRATHGSFCLCAYSPASP